LKVGDLVKDAYSEVKGLIIETSTDTRLNLKKQKEHLVLWFDPPGESKLKYTRSWRREHQLEIISES